MQRINFLYIFLIILICSINFSYAENRGEILPAETQTGIITNQAQIDSFYFYGEVGQTVLINMSTESGLLDPYILLFAPDGTLETSANCGSYCSHVAISDYKLLQSDLYTIVIMDYGGDGTGDYSLSLLLIPGPTVSPQDNDGGDMQSGDTRRGEIDLNADTDAYTIFGEVDQTVLINMSTESGLLDPYILLFAPDGTLETSANCGSYCSHVAISDYKLLQSGLYTIVIMDYGGDGTGDYSLSFTKISAPGSFPSINLILNKNGFLTGDTLKVFARIVNGPDVVNVEEKIWIEFPYGDQMSIGDPHSTFTVAPNTDKTEEIYSYTFNGTEISGSYNIGARLLNPVSGKEISVDIKSYNFFGDGSIIQITSPKDGDSVPHRPYVRGVVADANAEVWVIVHPMETSDYWVQPEVAVDSDGKWEVRIYIGRAGDADVGKYFELMAVANPMEELYEGKILKGWPSAQGRSEIITVIRN